MDPLYDIEKEFLKDLFEKDYKHSQKIQIMMILSESFRDSIDFSIFLGEFLQMQVDAML